MAMASGGGGGGEYVMMLKVRGLMGCLGVGGGGVEGRQSITVLQ